MKGQNLSGLWVFVTIGAERNGAWLGEGEHRRVRGKVNKPEKHPPLLARMGGDAANGKSDEKDDFDDEEDDGPVGQIEIEER